MPEWTAIPPVLREMSRHAICNHWCREAERVDRQGHRPQRKRSRPRSVHEGSSRGV